MKLKHLKRHLHQNERERINQKNIPDFERSDFFQRPFCYLHRNLAMYGGTGKSFSEALILASVNPQYDKRLFIEFPEKYMLATCCVQILL